MLDILKQLRVEGKIDKKIFGVLIKVILEDTWYEYNLKAEYQNHLYHELERYKIAEKYYNKMLKAKSENKKEYFRMYAKGYLTSQEDVADVSKYVKDMEDAIIIQKDELNRLKQEVKYIKRFRP